ncbi:MAG: hypothetical protein WC959_12445 [Kiritimatiellales bacterium]
MAILIEKHEKILKCLMILSVAEMSYNGWRYGVGLPCRLFQPTTTVTGKLHYTAGYALYFL